MYTHTHIRTDKHTNMHSCIHTNVRNMQLLYHGVRPLWGVCGRLAVDWLRPFCPDDAGYRMALLYLDRGAHATVGAGRGVLQTHKELKEIAIVQEPYYMVCIPIVVTYIKFLASHVGGILLLVEPGMQVVGSQQPFRAANITTARDEDPKC